MSRNQFPRVGTPQVGVPRLPSKVPPKVGPNCVYLSWLVSVARPNRLPKRPGGEPCALDTVGGPAGTLLTL
jgi:hypothetical protein